jgi:ACT domain-containing protein
MSKTKAEKAALIEQLRRTPIVQVATEKVGISRSSYYRWRQDPEFSGMCDEALASGTALINDMAESQLLSAIRDKNMTAIIFWLKHHHKAYETRVKVDAKISQVDELSDEQSKLVEQALKNAGLLLAESDNNNEL